MASSHHEVVSNSLSGKLLEGHRQAVVIMEPDGTVTRRHSVVGNSSNASVDGGVSCESLDESTDMPFGAVGSKSNVSEPLPRSSANTRKRLQVINDQEFEKILTSLTNSFSKSRVESVLSAMHRKYVQSLEEASRSKSQLLTLDDDEAWAENKAAQDPKVVKANGFVHFYQSEKEVFKKNWEKLTGDLMVLNEEIVQLQDELAQKSIILNRLFDESSVVKTIETRVSALESQASKYQQKELELEGVLKEERLQFEKETLQALKEMEISKREEMERKRIDYDRDKEMVSRVKVEKAELVKGIVEKKLNVYSLTKYNASKDKHLQTCNQRATNLGNDLRQVTTEYGQTVTHIDHLKNTIKELSRKGHKVRSENQRFRDQLLEKRMLNLCLRRKIINLSLRNGCILREIQNAKSKLARLSSVLKVGKKEMEVTQRGLKAIEDDIIDAQCKLNFKKAEKEACLKRIKDMSQLIQSELKLTRHLEKKIIALQSEIRSNTEEEHHVAVMNSSCEKGNLHADKEMNKFVELGRNIATNNDRCSFTLHNQKKGNEELTKKLAKAHLTNFNFQCQCSATMEDIWTLVDTIADFQRKQKIRNMELNGISQRIGELSADGKLEEGAKLQIEKWRARNAEESSAFRNEIKQMQKTRADRERQSRLLSRENETLWKENRLQGRWIALLTYQRNFLCSTLMHKKTELALVVINADAIKQIHQDALLAHANLSNDLDVMKIGIRQLRFKIRQAEKHVKSVESLRHGLLHACKQVIVQRAKLISLEAKYVPNVSVAPLKYKLDRDPSKYEIQLKVQMLSKRLITKIGECVCLEESLLEQAIFMQKLQLVVFKIKPEPHLQKKILFKRAAANKKEKELKAATAELNMTITNVMASQSAIKTKEERIREIRGRLTKVYR